MIRASIVTSMLPPESTSDDRAALEPERAVQQRGERGGARALDHGLLDLEKSRIALASSSSSTVTISSTSRAAAPSVSSPTWRTAMPSAMVGAGGDAHALPACERARMAAPRRLTPITRTSGRAP